MGFGDLLQAKRKKSGKRTELEITTSLLSCYLHTRICTSVGQDELPAGKTRWASMGGELGLGLLRAYRDAKLMMP